MGETPPRELFPAWKRRTEPLDSTEALKAEIERPRAILTPDDRSFLLGDPLKPDDHERSERARGAKINRIRQRLRNAILDFTLCDMALNTEDRKRIFDPAPNAEESSEEVVGGVVSLVAFLYSGHQAAGHRFEQSLYTGVKEVERRDGWYVEPEFSIGTRTAIDERDGYRPRGLLTALGDDEDDEADDTEDTSEGQGDE